MIQDRRLHKRLAPRLSPLVLLDKSKYSLLFDLCEGGLAVGGFITQDPNRVISLEFDIPDGGGCIQAHAEIVWASDSGHRTGFRFLDLSDNSRRQLKDWISSTSAARMAAIDNKVTGPTFGTDKKETGSGPVGGKEAETDGSESSVLPMQHPEPRWNHGESLAGQNEEFSSEDSALYLVAIFIVVAVVMFSIGFLVGYYWRGRPRPQVKPIATAYSEYSIGNSAASIPRWAPQTNIHPVLSLDNPGFVLQVGAMKQEARADALSNDLRKKNFSAFVFRRGTDDFYHARMMNWQPSADK